MASVSERIAETLAPGASDSAARNPPAIAADDQQLYGGTQSVLSTTLLLWKTSSPIPAWIGLWRGTDQASGAEPPSLRQLSGAEFAGELSSVRFRRRAGAVPTEGPRSDPSEDGDEPVRCRMRLAVPRHARGGRREPRVVYVEVTTLGLGARLRWRLRRRDRIVATGRIEQDKHRTPEG